MRAYVIDEISPSDITKIKNFLGETEISSGISDIFWKEIPEEILSPEQNQHAGCKPHIFAMELSHTSLKLELLVRSMKRLNCSCIGYCTEQQRNFIIDYGNEITEKLEVKT